MKSKPLFENGYSYLLVSDFDQTLSFNDSGYVLCELLGMRGFPGRMLKEISRYVKCRSSNA
jgi:hypothetical protein